MGFSWLTRPFLTLATSGADYFRRFQRRWVTVDFTLTQAPTSAALTEVYVNGVVKTPTTQYTVTGTTLHFTAGNEASGIVCHRRALQQPQVVAHLRGPLSDRLRRRSARCRVQREHRGYSDPRP